VAEVSSGRSTASRTAKCETERPASHEQLMEEVCERENCWQAYKRVQANKVIVRYADDIVMGFEQRADAERFLQEWKERLRKFGLELHPDKTRLIEFGRFAAEDRKRRGEGKPETFNFLGFTHICAKNRKPVASRSIARLSVSDSQQNSKPYGRSFGGAGTNQWPKSGSG
jgi:hypothetical protein